MPLEIYKASAGSGKTFQIVREYLKMVFKRPGAYKNILAVTFTNKATAEMKDRILKELSQLSSGKPSGHLDYLTKEFHESEAVIRQTAHRILKLILHDYSRFSISTIDSLFQRLIRAFSREMHLNPTFRTEIDHQEILEEAVNLLFLEIDNNEGLRRWMLDYTEENLRDGRKWDLNGNLMDRGAELFKEEFKQFNESLLQKLADKNYLSQYSLKLREIVDQYERSMKEMGLQGLRLIEDHDLTIDQFKFGNTSFAGHFKKIAEGNLAMPGPRTLGAVGCCELWYRANDSAGLKDKIQRCYEAGLNELLDRSIEIMNREGILANSAKAILANLFSFGLLTDIALKVQEVSRERNVILLNDSTSILQKVISGNNSPFIYEKLGTIYRHFMLDEFQDTSNMQWLNLKPLIENSLAEGNKNIIVGDVKQSIYRWRNGDWNLLATQLEKDFSHFGITDTPLDTNWRSSKNIIDFNNLVFRESARILNADFESALAESGQLMEEARGIIEKVYSEHRQEFSGKTYPEGCVKVKFIDQDNQRKGEFREAANAELITQIETVQDNGIRAGDIAILVRGKSDGVMIAKALMDKKSSQIGSKYCYDIISNDSLIIGQSPVVRFILNIFSLLVNQDNDIVKADLVYTYYRILLPKIEDTREEDNLNDLFQIHKDVPLLFKSWFGEVDGSLEEMQTLPLYNLAAKIIESFKLEMIKGESIYLGSFLDLILQYMRQETGGISGFLDWWELSGDDKTISLSEGQDAITILTIHKSKGLEFKTVFVPFCDWDVVPQGNKAPYLWCQPKQEPFNLLDLVLVKYGSNLESSIFAEDYFREMLYSMVDNLNLLYVALTRAVNSLIIICPYSSKPNGSAKSISAILQRIIENPPLMDSIDKERYMDISSYWDHESKLFEFGKLPMVDSADSEKINGKTELSSIRLKGGEVRLKLRLHSEEYFELGNNEISARINFGRLLHEIFENISSASDVRKSIKRMVSDGKIDAVTAQEYQVLIDRMLSAEPFRSWFSGEWKVLNERNILRGIEISHRPDRVMIKGRDLVVVDYKTGEKSWKHHSQVRSYLKDFEKMGYVNKKGYLWYLNDNELVDIIE